jgi:hypothetical protein
VDLGVAQFYIPRHKAGRAKQIVKRYICDQKLTVRITKDIDPDIYEGYENGKNICEETYIVK